MVSRFATNMKFIPLLLLMALGLAFIPLTALAAVSTPQNPAIAIQLDGKAITSDTAPFIDSSGRTMAPVRFISEALGTQVDWDGGARVVTVTKEGTKGREGLRKWQIKLFGVWQRFV